MSERQCRSIASVYCAQGVKCQICRDFDALADALELALDLSTCDCPLRDLEIGGRGHLADCWTAVARAALKAAGRGPHEG